MEGRAANNDFNTAGPRVPRQRDVAALTPGTQLQLLMVHWRRRLRPEDLPKHVRIAGRRRRILYVSQEDVARAAKVATRWYATLERGELDNGFGSDLLGRVAEVLKLDSDERRVLFLLANGTEPAPLPWHQPPATVSPEIQAMLDCYPWPAYVTGDIWQVLALNEATAAWFPHVQLQANLMRWMFCDPGSRTQLVDWENVHAPLMLAQLRAQYARMPDAPALLELIHEVLGTNAHAHELWNTRPTVCLDEFTGPRQMFVAGSAHPTTVVVVSLVPPAGPEIRITTVVPIGGYVPENCATKMPKAIKNDTI